MFLKFGDKTRKIIVKESRSKSEIDDNSGVHIIYLDEIDDNDLRKKILKEYPNLKRQ
tara:strand:- start:542 stop:712 length:171 start_codon:yes stop_codon:yes gene_type:complete